MEKFKSFFTTKSNKYDGYNDLNKLKKKKQKLLTCPVCGDKRRKIKDCKYFKELQCTKHTWWVMDSKRCVLMPFD
jgi:hypothetical protein